MPTREALAAAQLAFGRILRIAARPFRPGDVEVYEECRRVILEAYPEMAESYTPNWARDREKGAASQGERLK